MPLPLFFGHLLPWPQALEFHQFFLILSCFFTYVEIFQTHREAPALASTFILLEEHDETSIIRHQILSLNTPTLTT